MSDTNPVRPQDRAEDMMDNWRKHGYLMFPQQRAIYGQLAEKLSYGCLTVLEAGCGSGTGSAVIERAVDFFTSSDGLQINVDFAKCLYPWIDFELWDICYPWGKHVQDVVICVECLEHVADPQAAVRNLLAAARLEVWISMPNGRGKPRPPSNPFHVREYTPEEVLLMIKCALNEQSQVWDTARIEVLSWETFEPLGWDTDADPLVYHIVKEQA